MNVDAVIRLNPQPQPGVQLQSYDVFYVNGVKIGEFYMEIDGFYVYTPEERKGYFSEHVLLALGLKLQELNAEWEAKINEDLKNEVATLPLLRV